MFKRIITLALLSAVGLAGLGCERHGYLAPAPYEYDYYDNGVYYEGGPGYYQREHRERGHEERHESSHHEGHERH